MKIPASEGPYVEFKSEKVRAKELAEEIVALANAEGGEIWLGVDDDGRPSGLMRSYEEDVMAICRTAVVPPLTPSYEEGAAGGRRVARVIVPKGADRPYATTSNKYFIRVGSTKRAASREELVRLFQASGLFHYDLVELGQATEAHLDLSAVDAFFHRYDFRFSGEKEEEKRRLLAASDIIGRAGRPTVGGLLVFGIAPERLLPQAGIALAHFQGRELDAELYDKKSFGGSLPRQVDNALAAIRANLPTPSVIEGTRRIDAPGYSDRALRELLVNAVVHRNYSITGSTVRVFLFADRLEIVSPGRLPNTVTIDKLPVGTSFARNPLIVRLMENLGYMDRLGRGLPMVCREAQRLGKAIAFQEWGEEFRVTLER
ncbi:MAG: RNA-binding domain-containing protein [Thermodesulfobacteriota bacterium]